MSKYNLIDIFEGMSDDERSKAQEADRLKDHPERDTIKKIQALMAKEKSLDEDKYDDIVDADSDIPADKKKAAALAYRKVDKGASYEKATSHIKEVRIDSEVADRIEGLTNRELKRKFLFAFEDLYSDLIEEDPFHAEDVINHLNNEMHKHLSSFQNTGDKFAGIEEAKPGYNEDGTTKSNDEMGDDEREDFYNDLDSVDEASDTFNIDKVASPDAKAHDYGDEIKGISDEDDTEEKYAHQTVLPLEEGETSMKDVVLAIIKDTNATNPEVQMYIDSLTNDIKLNGKEQYAEFSTDDFIEDFKEYISDKSLKEHFGRFMKDYQ